MAKKKRPTDINQKAKLTVDITRGEAQDTLKQKHAVKAAASALGKKGGLKRGPGCAKSLSAKRRPEIVKKEA